MLVTASFLLGRLESQSGENGLRSARAFEMAETGLASTLAHWDPLFDTLPIGGSSSMQSAGVATASWHSTIQRLDDELFSLRAEGVITIPGAGWQAKRQLGLLLRWAASVPSGAAVTVVDSVTWNGTGSVSGYSVTPSGWPACPADSVPGFRVALQTVLGLGGCPGLSCLSGAPPILVDTAFNGSVSTALVPLAYGTLAAGATRTPIGAISGLGPTVSGQPPVCDWSDPMNWGEPNHGAPSPCASLIPVIHASGDLRVSGGRGQGILLVDGDLILEGGFEFSGLVIVQGQLAGGVGSAHITGAVIARSLVIGPAQRIDVEYSACVLRKVLRGPSQVSPLLYRSWAQLY
jgi:hypothetical protein